MRRRVLPLVLALCLLTGCGAAVPGSPAEAVSPVYTDWSKLEPYQPSTGTYTLFEPYSGSGTLLPRDDYGPLLPYVGTVAEVDNYIVDKLPLYGLVTADGRVVTDPVYADIQAQSDFLVLYRGAEDGTSGSDTWAGGTYHRTLAAPDGSWVREFDGYLTGDANAGLIVSCTADGSLTFWNTDGEIAAQIPGERFQPWFSPDFEWGGEGGPWLYWPDTRMAYVNACDFNTGRDLRLYLDLETGTVADTVPAGYPPEPDYDSLYSWTEPPEFPGYNYLDVITDDVTGKVYYFGHFCGEDESSSGYRLLDADGSVLQEHCDLTALGVWQPIVRAGLVSTIEDGCFCYRSLADRSLVFRYPVRTNSD